MRHESRPEEHPKKENEVDPKLQRISSAADQCVRMTSARRLGLVRMVYFPYGIKVMVVAVALERTTSVVNGKVGESEQVGVMLGQEVEEVGQEMQQVGVKMSQLVERHLNSCHLVIITNAYHSHVTSTIVRHIAMDLQSSIIVDVESIVSNDLQPEMDYQEHESFAPPINPPFWKQTSQSQATENHPHRPQAAQEELARDNLLQGLWGDSRTTCRGLILDLTSSSNTTHLALRLIYYIADPLQPVPPTRLAC
ncbi:uncharacterized protein [Procambarus clarkii]|uniref:uncharacterized protein n=1 Tax=Procambarus clarkii TaxID=6728 RepID=UPI001E673D97|nr:uncharacterized protein LOC123754660 [Procambarus clarkii]